MIKLYALIFVFFAAAYGESLSKDPPPDFPNVFILTISSVRNYETIEDPEHRYMPGFFTEMKKEGFLYTNLIEKNFEFHMPPVQAINIGINFPYAQLPNKKPSIFQYLLKQGSLSKESAWSISHWSDSDIIFETDEFGPDTFPSRVSFNLNYSGPEGLLNDRELYYRDVAEAERMKKYPYLYYWPHWDARSRAIHDITKRIISELNPKLVHYVLGIPETAHFDSYPRYVHCILELDSQIMDIWNLIQEESFYKDNTFLFVVVDHQRNRYHMHHDEKWFKPGRNTWMYVFGPGVKKNKSSDEPVQHIDIFKTVSKLYGLNTHHTNGVFLEGCFELEFIDKLR